MKGYIIANSFATPAQRKAIDTMNRRGGIRRHIIMGNIVMCLFIVMSVAFYTAMFIAPPAAIGALGTAAAAVGILFYFGYYRPLGRTLGKVWVTTSHPDLIALDKEWLAIIAQEPDGQWRTAEDQKRFVNLRRLAELDPAQAAPEIAQLRRDLKPAPPKSAAP